MENSCFNCCFFAEFSAKNIQESLQNVYWTTLCFWMVHLCCFEAELSENPWVYILCCLFACRSWKKFGFICFFWLIIKSFICILYIGIPLESTSILIRQLKGSTGVVMFSSKHGQTRRKGVRCLLEEKYLLCLELLFMAYRSF